jgi:hypothetical protein
VRENRVILTDGPIQAECSAGVNGSPAPLHLGVDGAPTFRRNRTIIRAIIDDRIRRVCAILAGMAAMAVTVVMVTIMIHDRMQ